MISLDANDLSTEIPTNAGYSGGAQMRWLGRTLRAWRPTAASRLHRRVLPPLRLLDDRAARLRRRGARRGRRRCSTRARSTWSCRATTTVIERTDPIRAGRPTRPAPDGSTVEPATDGVTYLWVGSGGRARYPFPPGAGERYRGHAGTTGPVDSYVWVADGTRAPETVAWSRVRYDGYAFLAVDVVPARPGRPTTMTLRTLADALPGQPGPYTEIYLVTLRRVAGAAHLLINLRPAVESGPAPFEARPEGSGGWLHRRGNTDDHHHGRDHDPPVRPGPRPSPARCSATACIAGPFYVVVSLAQALTRDGFDLSRHAWSLLANGALGWIQIANFVADRADGRRLRGRPAPGAAAGPGATWAPRLIGGVRRRAWSRPASSAPTRRSASRSARPADARTDQLARRCCTSSPAASASLCLIAACFVLARRFAARRGAAAGPGSPG